MFVKCTMIGLITPITNYWIQLLWTLFPRTSHPFICLININSYSQETQSSLIYTVQVNNRQAICGCLLSNILVIQCIPRSRHKAPPFFCYRLFFVCWFNFVIFCRGGVGQLHPYPEWLHGYFGIQGVTPSPNHSGSPDEYVWVRYVQPVSA